MGVSVWMAWGTTRAGVPCSTRVSIVGFKASQSCRHASVCMGSMELGISRLLFLLPLGRACEQLVDFCSPDLNPCQHEAQCVGTPDGPRSVPPTARDPSLGLTSSLPSYPHLLVGVVLAFWIPQSHHRVAVDTALVMQPWD